MATKTFFLYGAPGSGKTTMACTAPKPLLIIDADCKALEMHNLSRDYKFDSDGITIKELDIPFSPGSLKEQLLGKKSAPTTMPMGYLQFVDIISELEDECPYKTVVIDSLTMLNEHLKRYFLFATKKSQLAFDGWEFTQSAYCDLFKAIKKIKGVENFILIAHERMVKVKEGEQVVGTVIRPLIESSMKDKFGIFFNEIYYCSCTENNNVLSFKVRTMPDEEHIARTSMPLNCIEEPDFIKILAKLK